MSPKLPAPDEDSYDPSMGFSGAFYGVLFGLVVCALIAFVILNK